MGTKTVPNFINLLNHLQIPTNNPQLKLI